MQIFLSTPLAAQNAWIPRRHGWLSITMHRLSHRRSFASHFSDPTKFPAPLTNPTTHKVQIGMDHGSVAGHELFGNVLESIGRTRLCANDPSIVALEGSTDTPDIPPHGRQRPEVPWYRLTRIQSVCLAILLLLFLIFIVFIVAVKMQKRKRDEIAQRHAKRAQQKAQRKQAREGEMDVGTSVTDNGMMTPAHAPSASMDKTGIKGVGTEHAIV